MKIWLIGKPLPGEIYLEYCWSKISICSDYADNYFCPILMYILCNCYLNSFCLILALDKTKTKIKLQDYFFYFNLAQKKHTLLSCPKLNDS